jgi:hypothetical protein
MKKILMLKLLIALIVICGSTYLLTGCCQKCCSPSIEVGVIAPSAPYSHYTSDKIRLWTWDPVTNYPQSPNILIPNGASIQAFKPYLIETQVKNFSDVAVRDVAVGFYWAYAGWFDTGVPIGVTAVNLTPNQTKWVRSPATIPLSGTLPYHTCLAVKVFHPCDTDTVNNWFYKNINIYPLHTGQLVAVFPFVVDFQELEGRLTYKLDTKADVQPQILPKVFENEAVAAKEMALVKPVSYIDVQKGAAKTLSLVVDISKMQLKVGDSFEVTAIALNGDKEVSQFTVQFVMEK